MELLTTKPERFLNYYKLYQIIPTAWINCEANASTERWNSLVEFEGKKWPSKKNLDKLTIFFYLNRIYELFDGSPC